MDDNIEQSNEGLDESVGLTDQGESNSQENSNDTSSNLVEVNGEKLSIDELKNGYMRQSDYTRKTQEIASQRNTYVPPAPPPQDEQYLTEEEKLGRQVGQLNSLVNGLIHKNIRTDVDIAIDKINRDPKYGDLFKDPMMEELLLSNAMQTGKTSTNDLSYIADRIHSKILKEKTTAIKQKEQEILKNINSPSRKGESGKGSFVPPKDFDPSKLSFRELDKLAISQL